MNFLKQNLKKTVFTVAKSPPQAPKISGFWGSGGEAHQKNFDEILLQIPPLVFQAFLDKGVLRMISPDMRSLKVGYTQCDPSVLHTVQES